MRSAVKNEQIEPWAIMGKYDSDKQNEWLIPHFLPIMDSKMGQYSPNMGKMGNIPPPPHPPPPPKKKNGKNRGDEEFVLYILI